MRFATSLGIRINGVGIVSLAVSSVPARERILTEMRNYRLTIAYNVRFNVSLQSEA